jgi:hypothetical protein
VTAAGTVLGYRVELRWSVGRGSRFSVFARTAH